MKSKIKYYHFFILSIALSLTAFGIWYFAIYAQESKGYETYTSFIEKKISDEVRKAEADLNVARDIFLKDTSNFYGFIQTEFSYPIYIYHKDDLVYWSDNKFAPKRILLNTNERVKYIQLPIGKYIVVKKKIKSNYEVFSFIPLTYEYSINNNYISSGLNEDIFTHENVEINNFHTQGSFAINLDQKDYLFSLNFISTKSIHDKRYLIVVLVLSVLSIFCLLGSIFYLVNKMAQAGRIAKASVFLLSGLVAIRALTLYTNFPYVLIPFDLFNSRYFASSEISPSLGDLFINIIFFSFFSWFVLKNYNKSNLIRKVILNKGRLGFIYTILLSATSLLILFYLSYIYAEIYSNSQFSLDITQNIDITIFKVVSLMIFILVSGIYFIYNHIALRLYILIIDHKSNMVRYLPILLVSFLAEFVIIMAGEKNWALIPVNLIYWLILLYFSLPRNIGTLKYSTYLYFLLTAFVCSFSGAINLYYVNAAKSLIEKHKYAFQLLNESDLFSEYLLNESMQKIEKDKFISTRFKSIFSSKDLIVQKIKKVILPEYLGKYEVHVSVFDSEGNVLVQNAEYTNYYDAYSNYAKDTFSTEYVNIYFLHEKNNSPLKRYMAFQEIYDQGSLIGSVILELVHKKNSPNSVYPELLVDKKFITPRQYNSFQYGIYDGKLLLSKGNFNYEKYFNDESLKAQILYVEGVEVNGYHHLGVKSADGKVVLVSTEAYSLGNIFSNFSFLFFLLLVFVLFFVAGYFYYFQFKSVHLNYATKILVYLNVAFFLPLVIVSIVTLSLISNYYKISQNKSFVKKAEGLSVTILNHFESYQDDLYWESKMENDIAQLSNFTGSDINLYNKNGELLYSYHPAIYERNLLSKQLNSEAYIKIKEEGANEIMLSESLGKLKYNTVYMPIKSYKTGELLGILGIPFFESREDLNKQLIGIFTTTLNIFSVIFIVFAGLSYFASRVLTSPLNIITQKIRKTTLGENVPLDWHSKDEIGLLITEYNSMLVKLEENRLEMSKNEKESAWREMAKQVAHEIKNPLTPMKLKIQHLQRSWAQNNENILKQNEEGLQSLLDQVNILNEIASSFSAFAKMPIPKHEHFNISEVLKSTVNLYNNTHDVHVDSNIEVGEYIVEGDEQLMGSIFTNLIINAIQSVPFNKLPKVLVSLSKKGENVLISIKDNGAGISASIVDKVFLPDFSTKATGSGVGLAVAKRGVEHAGGRIWFDTKLDEGTIFYVEIPLVN